MDTRPPRAPLLPLLLALVCGIAVASYFPGNEIATAGGVVSVAVVCLLLKRANEALWCAGVLAGALTLWVHTQPLPDINALNSLGGEWSGCVVEAQNNVNQRIVVEIDSASGRRVPPFSARLTCMSLEPPLTPGSRVHFRAYLTPAADRGPLFPGDTDLRPYYRREGISALSQPLHSGSFKVVGRENTLSAWLCALRWRYTQAVFDSGLSEGCAGLLIAVTTGDRQWLDDDTEAYFRSSGLAHLLALSGTHVAVIAFMVSLIFFPLRVVGRRGEQGFLTLAILWLFALFTGMSPSVVRAVIMASFLLVAQLTERRTDSLNTLCAAALLILIFSPQALFDLSFQLSFLAVAGIVMFSPFASHIQKRRLRWPAQWLTVSVSAVALTAPLAAWHFHTFPLYFLLANLPAGLLLPVFIIGGAAAAGAFAAGIPNSAAVWLTDRVYDLSAAVARSVSPLPGGAVEVAEFSAWLLLPYYAGVVALWYGIMKKRGSMLICGPALMLFSLAGGLLLPARTEKYSQEVRISNMSATAVVACEAGTAYLFTDAEFTTLEKLTEYVARHGGNYFRARGVRAVRLARPGLHSPNLACSEGEWVIYGRRYLLVPQGYAADSADAKTDFLIISKHYRGDICADVRRFRPDTVVISPALYVKRSAEVAAALDSSGVPYRFGL